jgi:hypothetical protein
LLQTFLAELAQLDTSATAADPDGAGPLASGYDVSCQETVLLPSAPGLDAMRVGRSRFSTCRARPRSSRSPRAPRSRPATRRARTWCSCFTFATLSGSALSSRTLETRSCASATGSLRSGIDAPAISSRRSARLPGLYLTEPQPEFGLGGRRNLLIATFSECALGGQGGT